MTHTGIAVILAAEVPWYRYATPLTSIPRPAVGGQAAASGLHPAPGLAVVLSCPQSRQLPDEGTREMYERRHRLALLCAQQQAATCEPPPENPVNNPNLSDLDREAVQKATTAAECLASSLAETSTQPGTLRTPEGAAVEVAHAYLAALKVVSDAADARALALLPATDPAAR